MAALILTMCHNLYVHTSPHSLQKAFVELNWTELKGELNAGKIKYMLFSKSRKNVSDSAFIDCVPTHKYQGI